MPNTAPDSNKDISLRPTHQRSAYKPSSGSERFIVPLLAERISALFETWCEVPPTKQAKALDAGCGMQPFRELLTGAGYLYCSCDAVQNREKSVDFVTTLDGEIPAELHEAGPFNLILCTEVLEHVADWGNTFHNLAALLAPGGRILISVPHFYPIHEAPYDYWRPTPFAIEEFARRSKLTVRHIERAGSAWEVLGTLLSVSRFHPRRPGFIPLVLAVVWKTVRRLADYALASGWMRRTIEIRSPYFLSCLAVLEK